LAQIAPGDLRERAAVTAFDLAGRGTAPLKASNAEGQAPRNARLPIRFCAVAGLVAVVSAMVACDRAPHHPDWVIHSGVEVIGPPPAAGYRLIFPYIVGDLYGSANTGAFVVPVSRTPAGFTLDLNRTQEALAAELAPTDFGLRFLRIAPRDARIARLAPEALQRNGIDPVGTVEWRDGRSGGPLMLVYADRPARIAGTFSRGGATLRYDIRVVSPGYVWIGADPVGEHQTLYTVVPPPRDLVLTITTGRK
jgi:hypothetical protein